MPSSLRIAYFAHTLRSDWNNGNAHFLRGLLRALRTLGHDATAFEPDSEWSADNLRTEPNGAASLQQFLETYADLDVQTYAASPDQAQTEHLWRERLLGTQVVILHEWNPPALAHLLLRLRGELGFKLLFHDTHHRASSSPESFATLSLDRFDGILAFGESLANIYRQRFHLQRVWTLHEAADTTVFKPLPRDHFDQDVVWIGNWGDGERAAELRDFLIQPAAQLATRARFTVFGVRYPEHARTALQHAAIEYGGYLPNLSAPQVYARSRLTLHVARQQYTHAMTGIPTIRVFEALACGIPLISAPWIDAEHLFREGDFASARTCAQMSSTIEHLLSDPAAAQAQAARGLETVLARHTCTHRALQLTAILEDLLS